MPQGGDLIQFTPGGEVDVEVVADSNGTVAGRGDGVQLTGDTEQRPQVKLVEDAGKGIGILQRDVKEYDESDAPYSAGEVVGVTEVILYKPVILCNAVADFDTGTAGTQGAEVGQFVEFKDGGEIGPNNGNNPYGIVWSVTGDPFAPTKLAIAVFR